VSRSPPYGGAVLLRLGPSSFDVAERALVVAALPPGPPPAVRGAVDQAVAEGADVVELTDAAAVGDAGVPVAVRTSDAAAAGDAFAAGAVLALDPSGFADPRYLAAALDAGASVVGAVPAEGDPAGAVAALRSVLARATEAGVPAGQVAVEPVAPSGGPVLLPRAPALRCAGVPVLVSLVRESAAGVPDPGAVAGPLSVAVVRGAGLLRVGPADVRSARRVADVIGAVRRGRP
jgi:dihydropteroate synthase